MTRFARRALCAALGAASLMLATGLVQAQERTFKLALQNPKGHPLEIGASKFAELVAADIAWLKITFEGVNRAVAECPH